MRCLFRFPRNNPVASLWPRPPLARALLLLSALTAPDAAAAESRQAIPIRTSQAANLVANGSFDRDSAGWKCQLRGDPRNTGRWSPSLGRGGGGALELRSTNADTALDHGRVPFWMTVLDTLPAGSLVAFDVWIRCDSCTRQPWASLTMLQRSGDGVAASTTEHAMDRRGTFDWTRFRLEAVVPSGTSRAMLALSLNGGGVARFDDVALHSLRTATAEELRAHAYASADSGGLFRVRAEQRITNFTAGRAQRSGTRRDSTVTFTIALPGCNADQAPVTYRLSTMPARSLLQARLRKEKLGNVVAEVMLASPAADDSVVLKWESLVVARPRGFSEMPEHANRPKSWPAEAAPWLSASRCVESEDPEFLRIADTLTAGTSDVLEIIHRAMRKARQIRSAQSPAAASFSAVEALEKRGSCLSNANLFAAMLRAAGIPARIVSGLPTWSGPLSVHFLVQAWVPGHGWAPIEPTLFRFPWPPSQQLELAVVPVEYEDAGAVRKPREGAACLPYLSVEEAPVFEAGLMVMGTLDRVSGVSRVVERVAVFGEAESSDSWADALTRRGEAWKSWVDSDPRLDSHGHLEMPGSADAHTRFTTLKGLTAPPARAK